MKPILSKIELTGGAVMKKTLVSLILVACVGTALAVDKAQLDQRIHLLTAKLQALQSQPDKRIPADVLRRAEAVVLLDRTKAGFLFAYQGGGGVALARDAHTREWSPVAFVSANEASLGFQIGGEQNFFVILLMNTNTARVLTQATFDFGGEARGTAGDVSSGVEASVDQAGPPVLVYGDRQGLYGGVSVKAGALAPDNDANRVYYERFVTMSDILFDKRVKATEASKALAATLRGYAEYAGP
jgi:SH3 domain-containing YSC84-like protein 1